MTSQYSHLSTKSTTSSSSSSSSSSRRDHKSPESWALSDLGRLSMTPLPISVHGLSSPCQEGSDTSLLSISSTSSPASPTFPLLVTSSSSYTTTPPQNGCPGSYPVLITRERQDSTASTSSSSVASSGYSSCTEYDDDFPDQIFPPKRGRGY